MTNLDEDVMAQFLNTTGKNAKKVTQVSVQKYKNCPWEIFQNGCQKFSFFTTLLN